MIRNISCNLYCFLPETVFAPQKNPVIHGPMAFAAKARENNHETEKPAASSKDEMSNGWHKRACLRMECLMESCCFWRFSNAWLDQNSPVPWELLVLCASPKAQYQMKSGLLLNVVVRPRGCTLHGINISHLAKRKIIFKHDF